MDTANTEFRTDDSGVEATEDDVVAARQWLDGREEAIQRYRRAKAALLEGSPDAQ